MAASSLDHQYGFRDLGPIPPGHFSPVGMARDGSIFGTFVSARTGESQAMLVTSGGDYRELTGALSLVEGVNADGVAVGSFGYGERAFAYRPAEGVIRMGPGDEVSTAMCVGPDGLVGGSAEVKGVERGALFAGSQVEFVPPPAQVILAIGPDGRVAGRAEGRRVFLWRRGESDVELVPVEGQTVWVAGFLPDGTLILTVQEDYVKSFAAGFDGGLWRLPGLGGDVCRVASVGLDGSVLMAGTTADGTLGYGVWRRDKGLMRLDASAMPGVTIESLNAVGPEGQVVGLAKGVDGARLVVGSPISLVGRAAVEMD